MQPDPADNDAAPLSSRQTDPRGHNGQGLSPRYLPSWVVVGIALISVAIQLLWLPRTPEISISDLIAETIITLIPLVGLFVVQHLRPTPRVYWPMMLGFSFLLFSHLTDLMDEIRIQPAIIGMLIEDGLAILGHALLIFGLIRWLRLNQQLLTEIQTLNTDLERRVASRTARLDGEIAERQQAEERLRDSEQRYRELNAELEQRVAERTAEVQATNALLREREESLQFILEGSRLGAWDWHIAGGKVERNDYWATMLGYSRQEVDDATADGWLALIHPDDQARARQSIEDHLAGRTALHEMEYRMRTRDGGYRWILDRARIVSRDENGRPLRMSGTHEDITSRKEIEDQLRQSEERFRLLATHAIDNIWLMGADYRLRYISPSIQGLTGYTAGEYTDLPIDQQVMPDSLAAVVAYFAALDERRAAGISVADYPFRGEIALRAKDGSGVCTEIIATPLVDSEGRMTELAGVTRDIRERKRYEAELQQAREAAEIANRTLLATNAELQRLATTDQLTGISNRLHFDEAVDAEIERANRYGEPLSLLLFDLDHFKAINDTHGHLVGDQVLIELTRRVRQQLRSGDVLARWGGEEFVALLPHTRAEDALKLAEKLRQLIAGEPFPEVGQVTSSFGVAQFQPPETSDFWLTRVDDALYAAKDGGRNQVRLAPPTPETSPRTRV